MITFQQAYVKSRTVIFSLIVIWILITFAKKNNMELRSNNILIPVDFGDQSMIAIDQSYNIARMANAELNLLHVIDNTPMWGLFSGKEQSDMVSRIETKLRELASDIQTKSGLKVNTMIEKGKLVDVIIEKSEQLKSEFIFVGTKSTQDFVDRIVGSNALRMIREAKCPVITIKGQAHREGCKNIVLPLDLTKETREKVAYAVHFAKYFGSTIHATTMSSSTDSYMVNRLRLQLTQVADFIKKEGVECKTQFLFTESGNAEMAKSLLEFSHKIEADLLIIMTQQETDVIKYFIGSLAKQIIHNSDVPVMSIVPKKLQ
ncbi:MAG: hypothetical protein CVU05_11475 [Bacteroidetes bacterium HGW-Bacteroidetes-21]|jgi:nucleotide-binding universal stress UspA family protein|nr:MAG: hypothetical protein CVU05_11475 [Bacteroidetes bacterium HGW-Bacteroidetes-21]